MSTTWLPILGYEGRYEVSDSGFVRRTRDGRILAHHLIGPYHRICLWNGSESRRYMLHRLVAGAFIGPCPDGHEVNHKDGDPSNNGVTNLEYVTPKENVKHSFDVLGVKRAQGERHGSAKLTDELVLALREEYAQGGVTATALAKRVGVNQTTMSAALTGRKWRHLS